MLAGAGVIAVSWSYAGLPVIESYEKFWTATDAAILYAPLTPRQCRELAARAGLTPAGRRPGDGRGRAPLVYRADDWCDVLSGAI